MQTAGGTTGRMFAVDLFDLPHPPQAVAVAKKFANGAIHNVRGLGLYQGFTLRKPEWKSRLVDLALQTENLLLLGAGRDSIRLRPNLNVTAADIGLLIEKLDRVLTAVCLGE